MKCTCYIIYHSRYKLALAEKENMSDGYTEGCEIKSARNSINLMSFNL